MTEKTVNLMIAVGLVLAAAYLIVYFTGSSDGLTGAFGAAGGMGHAAFAVIVMVLCTQAKLGLVPFDMAEAEQEIIAGPFTEYSGPPLGLFKLTKWMMLFVVPSLTVLLFFPGGTLLGNVWRWAVLLVLVVLIRNTNPRVRIDHAVRFFWSKVSVLSLIAVILALYGL